MDEISILVDKLKPTLERQLNRKIQWWSPGEALTRHQGVLKTLVNKVKLVMGQEEASVKSK
jgi:hypothetical protein